MLGLSRKQLSSRCSDVGERQKFLTRRNAFPQAMLTIRAHQRALAAEEPGGSTWNLLGSGELQGAERNRHSSEVLVLLVLVAVAELHLSGILPGEIRLVSHGEELLHLSVSLQHFCRPGRWQSAPEGEPEEPDWDLCEGTAWQR